MQIDILGRKFKKLLTNFQIQHNEKLYIHRDKIFQIIRVQRFNDNIQCEFINHKTRKINTKLIPFKIFNERRYYSYRRIKLNSFLNNIKDKCQ